jgi:hypothetical protein
MICCKEEKKRDFIMALKSNRIVALSEEDKENKKYISIKNTTVGTADRGDLARRTRFSLLLTKQIFKNENGTIGELYLACSDLNLSYDKITTTILPKSILLTT